MKISDFYGTYSSGAGFKEMEQEFFSIKNVSKVKKIINKNLKKMSVSNNDLENKIIMNVGSGREALGLLQYKPKKIYHYDVSYKNIKNFKKYLNINNLVKVIESKQFDLSKDRLPEKKFDFIYLHGIIQHVDHVDIALKNLILSMKLNGKMWFYFYRPGSLNVFLGSLQRKLLKNIKINKFKNFLKTKFKKNFIDDIMDDCYVPNRQLFYPSIYNKNLKNNFVENFGNTFLKNYSHKVNFLTYHESVVFFLKKKRQAKKIKIKGLKNTQQENVLKKGLYRNKQYLNILKIINSSNEIRNEKNIFEIIIKLELIKNKVRKIFYENNKLTQKEFLKITKNIKKIFNLL